VQEYFSGKKLYGDDFKLTEVEQWFEDEREGYANLRSGNKERYTYVYHQLNITNCYNFLPEKKFDNVLGLGSAYGHEFQPISDRISHITILEPSSQLFVSEIHGIPVEYVKPQINGEMVFSDNCFDLIISFGVLHHIPNVSKVLQEFFRCLKPGGYALIREPTTSMGDWRKPRYGLTKHERGIPINIFDKFISDTDFQVINKSRCMFSLINKFGVLINKPIYNSRVVISCDRCFCFLFSWNKKYHAVNNWQKFRPTSIAYVIRKPG